jgi:hypothetical protein
LRNVAGVLRHGAGLREKDEKRREARGGVEPDRRAKQARLCGTSHRYRARSHVGRVFPQ